MRLFALILFFSPSLVLSQPLTVDSIHREFERYTTGPDTLGMTFEPVEKSLLYSFYKDNTGIVEYLSANYDLLKNEYLIHTPSDSKRFASPPADSQYRNLVFERLLPLITRYLKVKTNRNVHVRLNNREHIKEEILKSYAIKFFYPDSIYPDGKIQTHICVGINGFLDETSNRNSMIEAFCFQVANNDVLNNGPVFEEFDTAFEAAKAITVSDDKEKRLLRIQGAVWALMMRSKALSKALLANYHRQKQWLPFVIE